MKMWEQSGDKVPTKSEALVSCYEVAHRMIRTWVGLALSLFHTITAVSPEDWGSESNSSAIVTVKKHNLFLKLTHAEDEQKVSLNDNLF
jgi:hypothetical protein